MCLLSLKWEAVFTWLCVLEYKIYLKHVVLFVRDLSFSLIYHLSKTYFDGLYLLSTWLILKSPKRNISVPKHMAFPEKLNMERKSTRNGWWSLMDWRLRRMKRKKEQKTSEALIFTHLSGLICPEMTKHPWSQRWDSPDAMPSHQKEMFLKTEAKMNPSP